MKTIDYRPTHTCDCLSSKDIDSIVTLSGWVHRRRDHGGLVFIDLRDRYGITQIVFDPLKNPQAHHEAEKLRSEYVISIKGKVIARAEGMVNGKIKTGDIEVLVDQMDVLSKSKTPPFSIAEEHIDVNEELRLKYRYLDIRRGLIAKNLVMRHKVMLAVRQYLDQEGFLEISTPILAKSTPEGARDYLVPSRIYPGLFYALPQSPQLFKQLLMVSGMDKYFQIAQCFRDEDLRADRQPEFTQIDIEMSFREPENIIHLIEGLLKHLFKTCLNIDIRLPFQRLSYQYCMDKYGCDRPDLRFGMPLHDLSAITKESHFTVFLDQIDQGGVVKGFCVKNGSDISRKMIDEYTQFVSHFGISGLAWMKYENNQLTSNIVKYFPEDTQKKLIDEMSIDNGDLIFMIAQEVKQSNQALDHLRRKIARDRHLIQPGQYEFLWVTEFPLFSWDREKGRLQSEHHPFTSPHKEDIHLIDEAPLSMRSSGYDIVLNGYEIGGGSQRIHNAELQDKIFQTLKLTEEQIEEQFGFFIEALSYGTPPHLGIAIGLDRLLMLLLKTENIKDVIAFPKTQKASDLMLECPSKVDKHQLKDLEIQVPASHFSWT